ncbi:cytochrome P450 [Streptomyces roseoverticillatus]|uniref:cytochrome P450 n=1 Tax=Streptomyces roseoverticillatus TaxID=66429 RepID=UPI001F1ED533|nr:cytochrome P450 [Streptomyces roseoverticillatus]MCF3104868.1 cytochrome P450 [Streptomyces roseoverticillatus]
MPEETFTYGVVPGRWPLFGHVWPLFKDPFGFLASLPRHGDLVEMRLGPTSVYVPTHPELLRQTLVDDRTFDKGGKYYDKAREMAGNGIATCAHKDHRRQRRLLQPAFAETQLVKYAAVMEQEIAALTETWGSDCTFDAYPTLYGLALRVVTRTLFSTHVDEEVTEDIRRSFDVAFGTFFRQMFLPQWTNRLPLPGSRRHAQALALLRGTVERVITESRGDQDDSNVLGALLAAHKAEGATVVDSELRDHIVTVLAAGSETVASTLTWSLYLLSRNPDAQAALQKEADCRLAGSLAVWDEIPRLSYTGRVITETIRLYPPGWLFTRVASTGTELAGRYLKPGTTVVITPVPVHRNPAVFTRPDAFEPDRWLPERAAGLPRGAFAGFGAGARKCIGDTYGVGECVLALASIARRRQVETITDPDVRPVPLAAFYRPRRLMLRVTRRTEP